jgi:hypothetical protein
MTDGTEATAAPVEETTAAAASQTLTVKAQNLRPASIAGEPSNAGLTPAASAASAEAIGVENLATVKALLAKIDALHKEQFLGTVLGNDVVLWNMVMKFKEAVKAEITNTITAIKMEG